ncbi:MAG: DUF2934 domain-containing protein [Candidatus Omnitrophica bacterium]|nr:DUF2934 domain-containing protein [Candidatus Omnitrophota bacterium]
MARQGVLKAFSESEASTTPKSEEIARVAYELFAQRGCEHGHDQEDWFRAEQIVRQRRRSQKQQIANSR